MSSKTHGHHHGHESKAEKREESAANAAAARHAIGAEMQSQLISVSAYGLWEKAGKPDGDEARQRFWSEAEQEIIGSHAR
jgi:hypothetical protein